MEIKDRVGNEIRDRDGDTANLIHLDTSNIIPTTKYSKTEETNTNSAIYYYNKVSNSSSVQPKTNNSSIRRHIYQSCRCY